jgi:hypothetical protein
VSPLEFIPEDQRDPEQVIRDAQLEMDVARELYEAKRDRWVELKRQAGHIIHEPVPRWN